MVVELGSSKNVLMLEQLCRQRLNKSFQDCKLYKDWRTHTIDTTYDRSLVFIQIQIMVIAHVYGLQKIHKPLVVDVKD
jgi:hypothetical protein